MDVIITAVGEFIWALSCGVVNFCVSSGLSVLAVFITILSAILASAFYKYSLTRENMAEAYQPDEEKSLTDQSSTEPLLASETNEMNTVEEAKTNHSSSISEVEVQVEDKEEQSKSNEMVMNTFEGSEEEIQKQQIANIYRLLNDQNLINNWTTTDFLDQLKMYGLEGYNEDELDSSQTSVE